MTPSGRLPFLNALEFVQFALLFPGEALHIFRGFATAGKESNWALYVRTFLLYHICMDTRDGNLLVDDHDRASFAARISLEADLIENALNRHVCRVEVHRGYICREVLRLLSRSKTVIYILSTLLISTDP